ncbi:HlyD family type I secretion periplasmic adaptor subunit [Marinovum sp. 2_MG-2023]|uniref:HlyD family type I secretion periplasmic adaptor subunit n=1 Tax=unclassified Marinovum TaxID=2647166 RepID=UPI0026E147F1|nr:MULTISPECIES: HlyD family type I secretion periplasmic adaptor subunit [unclassified Marinovum]MDO6729684.1 HlyD family type I secretion periplasmic adaptor subunit [Marinovum sp. 2_MG-2023]MDO6779498.1 HlyD family type I secretion periplasmic adaptor subunit [Marinovum sp. 1_MG-2023]
MNPPTFSVRVPMFLGVFFLVVLLGGFVAWAAVSQISGAVIASGQVEVDQNRQAIQHPDGGVVAELLVREGDMVEDGDVLIRLDPDLLRSKFTVTRDQLHEIMARHARLAAERDGAEEPVFSDLLLAVARDEPAVAELIAGQTRLFHARAESLTRETDQLRNQTEQMRVQIEGIEAQQQALSQQLELIGRELADQQQLLDKGLAQASRVLALQRQQAQLSGQAGELTAQKARALARISEIEISILSVGARLREQAISELRDLQLRERELLEQVNSYEDQLGRMDVRAPVAGVVYGLAVFGPSSVARPADPLMYLVPRDRPAIITARIAPINIDELYIGQEVLLRLTSLSQNESPEIYGEVSQLSADAFVDEVSRQPYYRAEIALLPGEVLKLPEGVELIPGMPIEAFIHTDDRTPLAYFLKPLTDYFARAFRES